MDGRRAKQSTAPPPKAAGPGDRGTDVCLPARMGLELRIQPALRTPWEPTGLQALLTPPVEWDEHQGMRGGALTSGTWDPQAPHPS